MSQTTANRRTASHPIDPQFLERWSPRAFDGSSITPEQAMTLFEAARWAPSSYNSQPWRFVYALRDTPAWPTVFGLLNEFNRGWAVTASLVAIVFSKETMKGPSGEMPSHSHSFDAGAAWMSLALQAQKMGLQAHGMTGIDIAGAPAALGVPAGYRVEAGLVVGRVGDPATLAEALRARETPTDRNPLDAMVFEGRFTG